MESGNQFTSARLITSSPRTVVVIPPVYDFYFTPHRFSSIGPNIVINQLKKKGIDATLLNLALMAKNGTTISLPSELSYLKPFILEDETGKCSFFKTYKRFGPSDQQCSQIINSIKPDLCFISCFAFCYAPSALQIAQLAKQCDPNTITVLGGAGVSAYPEYFLKNSNVDYTLSGEAEINLGDFLDYLLTSNVSSQNISGFGWKQNGEIHQSSVINYTSSAQIECPLILTDESKSACFYTVSLSRGCPSKCKFCSNRLCHGSEFRRCSQKQLDGLYKQLKKTLSDSPKSISLNFEDDNLLFDYPFWIEFIRLLKIEFPDTRFYAENGIDYRLMTEDKCRELISRGFSQFNFSIGSVNESTMKTVSRELCSDHYSKLLSIASESSIPVISYFICGFPDDTVESVIRNLAFMYRHRTLIGISLFYPVPGIEGYQQKTIFDRLSPILCCGSSAYPWHNSLSTETLITAFRLSRVINLSKSAVLNQDEKDLLDRIFNSGKLFTWRKNRSELLLSEVPNQDKQLVKLFFKNIGQNG